MVKSFVLLHKMVKFFKQRLVISTEIKPSLKKRFLTFQNSSKNFIVLPVQIISKFEEGVLFFQDLKTTPDLKKLLGTFYALLKQNFSLLCQDFTKNLILRGVGYRAEVQDQTLVLKVGFSKLKKFNYPSSIKVSCPTKTTIRVTGSNRNLVENFVFQVKSLRKPDAYKGKGILTRGQKVNLKVLKK